MSERHKAAALARGAARTASVGIRVDDAMLTIAEEMKANGGIYPYNGGAVSMAELARRADIDESTFYKKDKENVALREKAALWPTGRWRGARWASWAAPSAPSCWARTRPIAFLC